MDIHFQQVTKSFGTKKALHAIDVSFESNKIYGLLGRNGAGKTTLMQLLAGHILPTKGSIQINGQQPFNNRDILQNICLINESSNFNKRMKIKDILRIASMFYPNWSKDTAERLMNVFSLSPSLNTKGLSKGMESALGIIIGLASRSKVTIFDEPYIGLDASARYTFYDCLLEEYEAYPRTIILSTHLIDEVSQLFEEVILLKEGKVLLQHSAEEMIQKSIKVSGSEDKVNQFAKGKQVIEEKALMGMKTAVVYGEYISLEEARAMGLDAERSTIQDVMVHLTNMEGEKAYA